MIDTAHDQLQAARSNGTGRSAITLYRGNVLSQVLMAMIAGIELSEHSNPGEGTLHVLLGEVQLRSGDDSWDLSEGQMMAIPQAVHSVAALADSVVLLTVARPAG